MTNQAETGEPIAMLKIAGHGDHPMHGPVTVGRDPRADEGTTVDVDGDPLVSKSHFCVDIDDGDVIITDLGSSNGTYLHHAAGETAVPSDRWIPVPEGAEVEFGDQRLTIERTASPETGDAETIEHAQPVARPAAAISESFWAAEADAVEAAPDGGAIDTPPAEPVSAPPAEAGVECAQCHRELPAGSKFCDGCGAPIMPDADSAPAPAPGLAPAADPASPVGDPGHTVVVPPGGFAAAGSAPTPGAPAPAPAAFQPGPPTATGGPQYGGVPSGPPPQSPHQAPPPGNYAQGAPPVAGQPAPQQPGGLAFVDPAASSSGGSGKKILLGVAGLVVLGLIAFALVSVVGGDDSAATGRGGSRTVPTELDELWDTDVAGASGFPGLGATAVYVASEDGDDILFTSLRRDDGDENWESVIDDADFGALAGEFEETAVVSVCAFDAETVCSLIGLDLEDGDEVWREPIGDGFAFASDGGVLGSDGRGLFLLDPASGDRLERVRGEPSFLDVNALLVDDDGDVSAYDDDLQPLIDPVTVDDDTTAVAFDGDRLVVAIGDEIEYVDAAGEITSGPFLDGDVTRLVALDSSTLVAELTDEVVVYDVDGDDATERWSESGVIDFVADPDGGPVVVIDTGTERVVVDLDSGDERFDVDAEEGSINEIAATNAYVVTDRSGTSSFEGEAVVTAYDWATGDEIWSEDIEGAVRVDEIVVVVETDGDVIAFG